jgi:peptide/nickel transport system permease protein
MSPARRPILHSPVLRSYLAMLRRDRLAQAAAIFLVIVLVTGLVLAPLLRELGEVQDLRAKLRPPLQFADGLSGLLGTDLLGRSILFRMISGAQLSVSIALAAAAVSAILGTAIGIWAGYAGGFVEAIAMRLADVVLSFPTLLLALLFLYLLDAQTSTIITLLVVGRMPLYVRVARAETLEARKRLFVDAARSLGASGWTICTKEIAPVILPTILTLAALDIGVLMLLESGLSFLGLGVQPPAVSWGGMVAEGRRWINSAWWLTAFPGLAIFLTALSATIFSNWLRIAMDPAQRWRLETVVSGTPPAAPRNEATP